MPSPAEETGSDCFTSDSWVVLAIPSEYPARNDVKASATEQPGQFQAVCPPAFLLTILHVQFYW